MTTLIYDKPERSEQELADIMMEKFPSVISDVDTAPRRIFLNAKREGFLDFCKFLKDELGFEHVSCVSPVDYKTYFQVVYHISSYRNHVVVEIAVDLPHDDPTVDSIAPLWGGANWHEREGYDLMGVIFKGHPRLERLMLPDDYTFHPLRKDFIAGRRV